MADVAWLNTNTSLHAGSASSLSGSQSVTSSGSDIVAVVNVTWDSNTGTTGITVTDITYGGQAMTAAYSPVEYNSDGSRIFTCQQFWLANPPTGSNTLSITFSSSDLDVYAVLTAYNNVNQTTPVRPGTATSNTGLTGDPSLTVTSNVHDLTTTVVSARGLGSGTTNQTSDAKNTSGSFDFASDHATTAAASVSHSWSGTSGLAWCIAGFSLQTDSGGFQAAWALTANQGVGFTQPAEFP